MWEEPSNPTSSPTLRLSSGFQMTPDNKARVTQTGRQSSRVERMGANAEVSALQEPAEGFDYQQAGAATTRYFQTIR